MADHAKDREGPHHETWTSLLGLLHWYEFFISVDQTILWRRHLAWAKPKGKDIRDYTTQRFSSNMVFLSLLLGADINVLFNSAPFTTSIRHAMMNEEYSLKFFIGIIMVLAAFVSVIGLVATFTAWGMISAISDSNSHSLLRSSIGEYVVSLPSRFVVGSLYLFLLWLVLLLAEIVAGPFFFVVLSFVLYLFFQVVVSLSTFGRLIIHTGAMGKKRVLDPELERYLLPSGLHASLLIKATERSRRKTSVVSQYKDKSPGDDETDLSSSMGTSLRSNTFEESNTFESTEMITRAYSHGLQSPRGSPTQSDQQALNESTPSCQTWPVQPYSERKHRRDLSMDSVESVDEFVRNIRFPRASILNRATCSYDLRDVVEMALSSRQGEDETEIVGSPVQGEMEVNFSDIVNEKKTGASAVLHEKKTNVNAGRQSRVARRQSQLLLKRGSSRKSVLEEWKTEEDVRNMYDVEPPAPLVTPELKETKSSRRSFFAEEFDRKDDLGWDTLHQSLSAIEEGSSPPKATIRKVPRSKSVQFATDDIMLQQDRQESRDSLLCNVEPDERTPLSKGGSTDVPNIPSKD